MRVVLLTALMVAVSLAGCTDGGGDGGKDPVINAARLDERDVPRDGSNYDYVDCATGRTRLIVNYAPGPEAEGKFSLQVASESSARPYDEEGNGGIALYPRNDDEGRFDGNATGSFQEDITGTSGTWVLRAYRTTFHDGDFTAVLQCLEDE